mmetsp:Transcript_8796/g.21788  ORF Transcript_8796/g.21788 Transcript_8796/m.21788 type:complete len:269 (+) Transcript_8796:630-1436(+)
MHYPLTVDVAHGARYAAADGHRVVQRQPLPPHSVGGEEGFEGAAERCLCHEVEVWERVDADSVQPDDPRVALHKLEHLSLLLELPESLLAKPSAKRLHCDGARGLINLRVHPRPEEVPRVGVEVQIQLRRWDHLEVLRHERRVGGRRFHPRRLLLRTRIKRTRQRRGLPSQRLQLCVSRHEGGFLLTNSTPHLFYLGVRGRLAPDVVSCVDVRVVVRHRLHRRAQPLREVLVDNREKRERRRRCLVPRAQVLHGDRHERFGSLGVERT